MLENSNKSPNVQPIIADLIIDNATKNGNSKSAFVPLENISINIKDIDFFGEHKVTEWTSERRARVEPSRKEHQQRKAGKNQNLVFSPDYYQSTKGYFESEYIADKHREDWRSSGVDDGIIDLNIETLRGEDIFRLIQSAHYDQNRLNSGRLASAHLKYFNSLASGGWWCSGLDPLNNWELMAWGCFKPDEPRSDVDRNRPIKYEHPAKVQTKAFFLRVPQHIVDKIAKRHGVEPPNANEFWVWVAKNSLPVTLVEGAKKAGALLTAGYIAIGLPSHSSGYRANINDKGKKVRHLIPELDFLKNRPINLALDQDEKVKTREFIKISNIVYSQLFKSAGCPVKILDWQSTLGKGVDDVFVTHGQQRIDEIFGGAKTSSAWKTAKLFELTYDAQIEVASRYLLQAFGIDQIPETERLIGIKAVKGTGKTFLISELVKEGLKNGEWVLVITHRIQLGKALAKVIGVNHVSEIREDETGTLFGYAVCFESLHPKSQAQFNADHWKGRKGTVILDECEQSFWSLLSSSTCENNRLPILKQFSKLIGNTLAEDGQGRVILSDADLSNLSLNLIRDVVGRNIKPFIIKNNWEPGENERWNVYRYKGNNPGQLLAQLEEKIRAGQKVFITLSGQKSRSKYSTKNLEERYKKLFPDFPILRIDAETVRDPSHPAFGCMANLNEILPQYRIVICSPTVETGVSIELSKLFPDEIDCHFDSVWCIAQGISSVNSVLQSLARIRENVDRHIWAKATALNSAFIGNASTNPKELWAVENATFKKLSEILKSSGAEWDEISDEEVPNNVFYNCYLKMAARHNAGCWRYAESIFEYLKDEGHNIVEVEEDKESANSQSEAMGVERDENYLEERVATSVIAPFENALEYEKAKEAREKTQSTSLKERKWEIEHRYGQGCTPELIKKDDDGWHPQLRLHYYLGIGREYLPGRDKQKIDQMLEAGSGQLWKPTVVNKSLSLQIAAMEFFKVNELITMLGEDFTNSHQLLQGFDELIEKNPRLLGDIKTVFGVSIQSLVKSKDGERKTTPVEKINSLLAKLGLTLRWTGEKSGGRGEQQRIYRLIPIPHAPIQRGEPLPVCDGRERVFSYWLQLDTSKPQNVSNYDTVVTHQEPDFVSSSDTVGTQLYKDLSYNHCVTTDCVTTTNEQSLNSFPMLDGGNPVTEASKEITPGQALSLGAEAVAIALEEGTSWEGIKKLLAKFKIWSYTQLEDRLTLGEYKRVEMLVSAVGEQEVAF